MKSPGYKLAPRSQSHYVTKPVFLTHWDIVLIIHLSISSMYTHVCFFLFAWDVPCAHWRRRLCVGWSEEEAWGRRSCSEHGSCGLLPSRMLCVVTSLTCVCVCVCPPPLISWLIYTKIIGFQCPFNCLLLENNKWNKIWTVKKYSIYMVGRLTLMF